MQTHKTYGVHWADNRYFLHQRATGEGVAVSNPEKISPDTVRSRFDPPHALPLQSSPINFTIPKGFLNNPLVDMYLPKPHLEIEPPKIAVIFTKGLTAMYHLRRLSQLGWPIHSFNLSLYTDSARFDNVLEVTNLIPFTILGITPNNTTGVYKVAEWAKVRTRRLVLVMDPYTPLPPGAEDYTEHYHAALTFLPELDEEQLKVVGGNFFLKHIQQLENAKWKSVQNEE